MNGKTRLFSGYYMIAFLTLCCVLALATIAVKRESLSPGPKGLQAFMTGKITADFEKKFEEHLFLRDQIVGLWGAVQYGIFKSGGRKVVVGKDDWLFTTEEFERLKKADEAEKRLLTLIEKVNAHLQSHDVKLAVVLVPAKARIYPEYLGRHRLPEERQAIYPRIRDAIAGMGIPAPDIAALYLDKKAQSPLYLRLDTHWTPEGSALAADALAETVGEKILKEIGRPGSFKMEASPSETVEGDLEKYIKTGVFSPLLAPERDVISRSRTEKASGGAGGGDLFGEEVVPVTLVGTSYSAIEKWDFEGALKMALQADVLNLADEGQGPLEPMAKFLTATDLEKSGVKLVVWEIPERFVPVSYDEVKFPEFIEGAE